MSIERMLMPVLNVGRLSDGRYKFCFATNAGTLFTEISVAKVKGGRDLRSDDQKMSEALTSLKRVARELDVAISERETV